MIVEPSDDCEGGLHDVDQLVLDTKDISHDQIELMGPAEQDNHPSKLLREKSLTLLCVRPIVCAPVNNLNSILLLHHDFITSQISNLWSLVHQSCHVCS